MSNVRTVALKCPSCGAGLSVGESVDLFACGYCSVSVAVERTGGIISLRLLTDAVSRVQRGTDRTAAELALKRLTAERKSVQLERQAFDASTRTLLGNIDSRIRATKNGSSGHSIFLGLFSVVGLIPVFLVFSGGRNPFIPGQFASTMSLFLTGVLSFVAVIATAYFIGKRLEANMKRRVAALEDDRKLLWYGRVPQSQALAKSEEGLDARLAENRAVADS